MAERRARPIHATRYGEHDIPPSSDAPEGPIRRHNRAFLASSATESDNQPQDTIAPSLLRRRRRSTSPDDLGHTISDGLAEGQRWAHERVREAAAESRRLTAQWSARRHEQTRALDEALRERMETRVERVREHAERRREYEGLRQRYAKRRRIDADATPISCPPIKYGYHGQVEPGRLKMLLISCDGGEHTDPTSPHVYLGPHNVLRADKSVYCSARKSASIILRHADNTPFSLTQISVVAPANGFTAPVTEGVAYIGMSIGDLIKYTDTAPTHRALPQLHHESSSASEPSSQRLSLSEALQDPLINEQMEEQTAQRDHIARESSTRHTTLLSDVDLGPEDVTTQEVLDYRFQRMQLSLRRQNEIHLRHRRYHRPLPQNERWNLRLDPAMVRSHRHLLSDNDDDNDDAQTVTQLTYDQAQADRQDQDTHDGSCPDPKVTFAHFAIHSKTNQVTINFETPISGRFVLLKLNSEYGADNVDVQTIMVNGFAGPRFFPAVKTR